MAQQPPLSRLLGLSDGRVIARRYFVTNGFDGALTLFGIVLGFYRSHAHETVPVELVIHACTGAAVALSVSGAASAYLSETAERRHALKELENAMLTDLDDTAHGHAGRLAALLIAAANGLAPLLMSAAVIAPLLLHARGVTLPLAPLHAAAACALACLFLLGIYLGRLSGAFWLWAGARTVLIALATSAAILLLTA